jgi:hypothetical protein
MLWILFRNKVYVFASLSSVFFLFGIIGRSFCSLFSKFVAGKVTAVCHDLGKEQH